ncbi:tRNA (guanine(26)-N(2))-dimethyltransferase [Haloferax namakaokahaiae]|uniref:tRNA (guanine(26)-N(2))-dimethyltransferase n=1 Tax=Haloferax namakaokahaiae TaxID=1748331 RepID=A0ABD5ZHU7_9EURY
MFVSEGGVEIEVPSARDGASEGTGDGVFYNPTQELNRDVTVAVLRAYAEREPRAETYLDAMAASGIRGVRAANEGYDVTCADLDPDAVELAQRNLDHNGNGGEAVHRNANALLYESDSVFDVVDLDPFGTPMPFADPAMANTRDLVCVTATDTAPLCGAHQKSGIRKYGCLPQNTDYHSEMGLRVLVGALVRTAARHDKAAIPILSHATRHYARTYLELDERATKADELLDSTGFVYNCEDCLHREHEASLVAHPPEECSNCGSTRILEAGPIWLGPICDRDFVASVREHVTDDFGSAKRARKMLDTLEVELDTPTHFDQHRLTKLWGRSAPKMDDFLDAIREAGFEATDAHYHGTAFKTDATIAEIREATAALDPES